MPKYGKLRPFPLSHDQETLEDHLHSEVRARASALSDSVDLIASYPHVVNLGAVVADLGALQTLATELEELRAAQLKKARENPVQPTCKVCGVLLAAAEVCDGACTACWRADRDRVAIAIEGVANSIDCVGV